jgi:hypothetical protein
VLVPYIGNVVGVVHIVPDPLVRELNILERFSDESRLGFARGLSARMHRVDEFKSGGNTD